MYPKQTPQYIFPPKTPPTNVFFKTIFTNKGQSTSGVMYVPQLTLYLLTCMWLLWEAWHGFGTIGSQQCQNCLIFINVCASLRALIGNGCWIIKSVHYDDVIMSTIASQITSLTIVYSTVYSGADQRKHQSSASLAFVRGIHRGPVNPPHKGPGTRKSCIPQRFKRFGVICRVFRRRLLQFCISSRNLPPSRKLPRRLKYLFWEG